MIRRIINIDEEKCNGCGACVSACHEEAIKLVNGKAKLMRDDYCDGLGDCLPTCPAGAITFVEREAAAYDEQAVLENKSKNTGLSNWPVQIKLVPVNAPYYDGAKLLVAADCTAYAYKKMHEEFMKGKVTIIGCPKLDSIDYSEKLAEIIKNNDIKEIAVIRMQVPCCGGIEYAVKKALKDSGKDISYEVVTISTAGKIL
jgi:hypothetical protein